jgi:hypothetical protein
VEASQRDLQASQASQQVKASQASQQVSQAVSKSEKSPMGGDSEAFLLFFPMLYSSPARELGPVSNGRKLLLLAKVYQLHDRHVI